MIKCGVIGMGRFGNLHARTLAALGEVELVAIVARRQDSLDAAYGNLPEAKGYVDLELAISDSGADAWVVACTTSEHVSVVRQLLEAGKKVLLEKPISQEMDEAESLGELVAEDSSNLMLGHILLFNSEFRQLRSEVKQRGKLYHIDAVRHRPASILQDFRGENPLYAAMVHDLYCAQALLDGAEPQEFSCQYHTTEGAIDLANATLTWGNGVVGRFAASFMTPAGMPPRGVDRMEVFGAGWSAKLEPNPRPLTLWSERAEWPLALEILMDEDGTAGMMAEEQRCFLSVVRGERGVPIGARYEDALQVQRWMDQLDSVANNNS
ncbi:MAG: Gfo/Idh/MocA family oxidoreductase [Planctomycetaceae bacterium]|jgi:predicted dehydrogenase|nr:Gfo/Idh/MocA family oxidoreductase [Planctomycetaceae bacterium]